MSSAASTPPPEGPGGREPVADKLREEILQSEQARLALERWKLGLIGVIGAVGLGLAGSGGGPQGTGSRDGGQLLLAVLPLVCLYVDLSCWHLGLRILVIGRYVRTRGAGDGSPEWADYEQHVHAWRQAAGFQLEELILAGSTLVISAFVAIYGVAAGRGVPFALACAGSGLIGIAGVAVGWVTYRRRSDELDDDAPRRGDLRSRAEHFLQGNRPDAGEVRHAFVCQSAPNFAALLVARLPLMTILPCTYVCVAVTDDAIYVLEGSRLSRGNKFNRLVPIREIPRATQLGPVTRRWSRVRLDDEGYWVHRRYRDDIERADAAPAAAPPP